MPKMLTWPLLYGPSNSTSCASFVHAVCRSFSQAATPGTCLGREYRNPLLIVEAVGGLCHFPQNRRQLFQKTKTCRCRWTVGTGESHPEKRNMAASGARRSPILRGTWTISRRKPRPGSPVVHRSQGGGSKDMWRLSEWREPDEDYRLLP